MVDPADPLKATKFLDENGGRLDKIFITHHHRDHVSGNLALVQRYGARVYGYASDAARIPGITDLVKDGDRISLGKSEAQVLFVPGHTVGHVAYWFESAAAAFVGDTIFMLGSGYLFEGTAEQMWTSISRLRSLPPQTALYCAHEYTLENAEFALHFDPENQDLKDYVVWAKKQREAGLPTIPQTLATEVRVNPFLRADSRPFKEKLKLMDASDAAAFGEIRRLKNQFDDDKRKALADELF